MTGLDRKRPDHETVYTRVKEMLLFGELIPGQPVTIHGLSEKLEAGVTPIREAIRRLTSEGALNALENRRVEVPAMTEHRLQQIRIARLAVEPELAKLALENIGIRQVTDLEQLDQQVNEAIRIGDIQAYLEANYRFHFSIYTAANAFVLQRIAESLWLQIGPSLRVVCGRFGTANLTDHHWEATTALREQNAANLQSAIEEDIGQGMELVRQAIMTD